MKYNIKHIVDKVYPLISKDYKSNSIVEIHRNIYERLGVETPDEDFVSYAEYLWDSNKIVLYTDSINSEEDVIRSLIHECVHSNQDYDIYEAYYDQCEVDYDTHPYEIEAEYEEENWIKYKII
tara:strand:+ start:918 stop:1286 length:369 start_codon:yes stop_codon:yes gene_type:complete